MLVDIDLDLNDRAVAGPGLRDALALLDFKLDTSSVIALRFWRAGQRVALAEGATGKFGIKQRYKFDGPLLALAAEWTKVGEGAEAVYNFYPALDTVALATLLNSGDADPDNDERFLDCMAEFRWLESGKKHRSQTIDTVVSNDVLKDADGTPTSLPTPEDWIQARALLFDREQEIDDASIDQLLQNLRMTSADGGLRILRNAAGGLELALWNETQAIYQILRITGAAGSETLTISDLPS